MYMFRRGKQINVLCAYLMWMQQLPVTQTYRQLRYVYHQENDMVLELLELASLAILALFSSLA